MAGLALAAGGPAQAYVTDDVLSEVAAQAAQDELAGYAESLAASAPMSLTINADQIVASADNLRRGSNLPAWLGQADLVPDTLTIPVTTPLKPRTQYSGIGVLRLPGGSWSDDYGWLSCEMGVYQYSHPGTTSKASSCVDASTAGWIARPSHFLKFLRDNQIGPAQGAVYTVNANATKQESAALVAFFNGDANSTVAIGTDRNGFDWKTVGYWAKLRDQRVGALYKDTNITANEYRRRIVYWEVGNELYGGKPGATVKDGSDGSDGTTSKCKSYGWETSWTCDAAHYMNGYTVNGVRYDGYHEIRAAMKAVDAGISVGAVGYESVNDKSNAPIYYNAWGKIVIDNAKDTVTGSGTVADFIAFHPYAYNGSNDPDIYQNWPTLFWPDALALPRTSWARFKKVIQDYSLYGVINGVYPQPGDPPPLGVRLPVAATEYNLVYNAMPALDNDKDESGQPIPDGHPGYEMDYAGNLLFIAENIGQAMVNGYLAANQWGLAIGCKKQIIPKNHPNPAALAKTARAVGCFDLLQYRNEDSSTLETFDRSPQYFAYSLWQRFAPLVSAASSSKLVGFTSVPALTPEQLRSTLSVYAGTTTYTSGAAPVYALLVINKKGVAQTANIAVKNAAGATLPILDGTRDVVSATALDSRTVSFNGVAVTNNLANDLFSDPLAPKLPKPTVSGNQALNVAFPPYSVTVLRLW